MERIPALAVDDQTTETGEPAEGEARASLVARVREWTTGSRLRTALVAGGLVGLTALTVGGWLVLAELAAAPVATDVGVALRKLDEGDYEFAEKYVRRMQGEQAIATKDYGGPLFVLGAVRAHEAERQWSPERRRRDYLIAAKYLDESLTLGVPEGREYQTLFLLGKSLIGSDQLAKGAQTLEEALDVDPSQARDVHTLLARAYYFAGRPDYQKSLESISLVLADPDLPDDLRGPALLRRAQALSRLGLHDDAMLSLKGLPPTIDPAEAHMVEGRVLIAAAAASNPPRRGQLLNRAEQLLVAAERLDKLSTETSAAAKYLAGRISQLRGQFAKAVEQFTDVRKRYGMSIAGVAASIAEGDILRDRGRGPEALEAYRRGLDAVRDITSYQSDLLPIADLRATVLAAHSGFMGMAEYELSLKLIERVELLLGDTLQLELRAETQQRWGESLLNTASASDWPSPELLQEGRLRLREAGVSYEQLAERRFATTKYPDDLWKASEAYYRGQSYTSSVQLLRDYIKNEPLRRNAQALLRLGQALLSLGDSLEAIDAFEECIEFHPEDAAVYGARLAAARAHGERNSFARAEELLRDNLVGGTLSPRSPEWRDSKFALGRLLHEMGRHTDAVDHLEEAILRYRDTTGVAKQIRSARYMAAESYRAAAEEPMQRYAEAKAVNERETNEQLFRDLLIKAAKHYDDVQREISSSSAISPTDEAMLRNCYMLKGSVYFDLGRFREAVDEYSNVSALYQNKPFVLETLLQISFCWRRLGDPEKARGNVDQALLALRRLPSELDLTQDTTRSRAEWQALLTEVRNW